MLLKQLFFRILCSGMIIPMLWDQLGNLIVQDSEYKRKLFKISLLREQVCTGEKKKDTFNTKI